MRRFLIIVSLLFCISHCASAQYADTTLEDTSFLHQVTILPTGYAGIIIGQGKEVAGFNGSGYQLSPCGQPGFDATVSLNKPLISHGGFSLLVGYCLNKTNTNAYCAGYEQQFGSGETITNASNQDFSELLFMAGPFFTMPFHRFSFDFRVMFGTMDWNSPTISYTAVSSSGVQTQEQVPGQGFECYVYGLGAGARLRVYKDFALVANADYVRNFSGSTNTFVIFETLTTGVAYQF